MIKIFKQEQLCQKVSQSKINLEEKRKHQNKEMKHL